MTSFAMAVDIGGTFTDVVLISGDGHAWTDKTLTTHHDLLEGFFRAADAVTNTAGIVLGDIDDVIAHATTVVTNALIERKGLPTGLITTKGFADVLYIRDEHRYDMFDPLIEYPAPLIARDATWEVDERVFADGSIGREAEASEIAAIAEQMREKGMKSAAICFLNAFRNPKNERSVRDGLRELVPDIELSLSSDVAPQMREYLRTSTTAINAYTVPLTRPYLDALMERLREEQVNKEPLIMLSNGGVIGARAAGRFPVRMIESGPAAGALVASHFARQYKSDLLISFDMGGTTAKACVISGGEPLVVGNFEVDRRYRFKPGSGMPITVPSIDMIEIGAGGGSIARVDALGLLKVGPDSAGSRPGPACYGLGGENATVTDANVVLGILDAHNFLGGDMSLDEEAARSAVGGLAEKLSLDIDQTAFGIFSVVGESMAAAARAHATDRGISCRGVPLLAFGGAGPVHACHVAELLESDTVFYPPMASVLSAYGTLVTPPRLDLARSAMISADDLDETMVGSAIDEMLREGRQALMDVGIEDDAIEYGFAADMRYRGQQNEVTVQLPANPATSATPTRLQALFREAYRKLYGVTLDDMATEIVSWRVTVFAKSPPRLVNPHLGQGAGTAKAERKIYFGDHSLVVPVFDRDALAAGQSVTGPVIVEERETTSFILPGWTLSIADDATMIARRNTD